MTLEQERTQHNAPAHTCPMCWLRFDNADELSQHEELEAALDWPLDGYDPSTYADM